MGTAPQQAQAEPAAPSGPVDAASPAAAAAPAAPATASAAPKADPAVVALLETGKQTYMLCAACHGPEGKAVVPNMAPNLAGSAYVNGPSERLSMIVLNGIQFPGTYLGQMIAWKAQLSDEQIAGVLSYIRSNFGNTAPAITPDMIKAAREKHGPRNNPYSRAELDQVTANL
jgi:mono/diheme cytochrome c family protein